MPGPSKDREIYDQMAKDLGIMEKLCKRGPIMCKVETVVPGESHTLSVLRGLREKAGLVCDDTNHPADAVDIYNLIEEAIRNEGGGV